MRKVRGFNDVWNANDGTGPSSPGSQAGLDRYFELQFIYQKPKTIYSYQRNSNSNWLNFTILTFGF